MVEGPDFDYDKAVARVEEIIRDMESSDVPVTSLGPGIREARSLIDGCRKFLRGLEEEYGQEGKGNDI